jgi:hypothetical protein
MGALRIATLRIIALGTVAFVPLDIDGQEPARSTGAKSNDSLTKTVAGQYYSADGFKRMMLGGGWRELWATPVSVPSLELSKFAGGLKVLERGGGYQSITLHLQEEKGWQEWRFRSANKFPGMTLPSAFRETAVGTVIQDQVSGLFPGSPLPVPTLLQAINALTLEPTMYRMGDDPRLGVYRDTLLGMLGTMEMKASEAPDDKPGFADSKKITGSEGFFKELRSSRKHSFDEQEFLAIRLIDLLINDGDRTPDNSDFARFGDSTEYRWRALAKDRDWAFMNATGLVNRLIVKSFYPKTVAFTPTYDMKGLTYSTHYHDRRLLQRLTRDDFASVANKVKGTITDDVIDRAIAQLPAEWQQTPSAARLRSVLRARRDAIPSAAMALYKDLATDVDVYATRDDERVEIMRHPDGRVTVTIAGDEKPQATASAPASQGDGGATAQQQQRPFYQRTFVPAETQEVRVFLLDGNDQTVVRGASGPIIVRVIGGYDDDVFADSASGGATHFYDSDGENKFTTARGTHVSERPWREPTVAHGMRIWGSWRPDWGGSSGWGPAFDYKTGAGVVVGVSHTTRAYGFRRLPHAWELKGAAMIGTGNGRVAVTGDADYRMENSPVGFTVAARASQLEAFRFSGYGNETPKVASELSLVEQTVLAFEPAVVLQLGWRARETNKAEAFREDQEPRTRAVQGRLEAGPVVSWIDPDAATNSPLATSDVLGNGAFGHVGMRASLELDRTDADAVAMRGWRLSADVRGFPPLWNLAQSFATTRAEGSVYVPLLPNRVHLAVRGGASMASGLFPAQYAATVGGWSTLRGHSYRRFSGDAAVDGSTELRVPLGTVNFLMRWNTGVFGLADVGRVWMSGESDGGWHTAFGGGVWLETLGRAISVGYAKGEEHRIYLKTGLF